MTTVQPHRGVRTVCAAPIAHVCAHPCAAHQAHTCAHPLCGTASNVRARAYTRTPLKGGVSGKCAKSAHLFTELQHRKEESFSDGLSASLRLGLYSPCERKNSGRGVPR